jgi:hypothetical protein
MFKAKNKKKVINYRVRGWGLEVRLGFGLTFGLIVDPLQPNTLLHTMALQRQ